MTEYTDAIAAMPNRISREFLLANGWQIENEYPLVTIFKRNGGLKCSIGKYGDFSISEYHWLNHDEIVRHFCTINHNLTQDDYWTIIKLLNISGIKQVENTVQTH